MCQYNEEDLRKALDEIRKKQIKIREACRKYGAKETLIDTVPKINKDSKQNIFKKQKPGKTWYYNFLKRNPEISLREGKSINKARTVNYNFLKRNPEISLREGKSINKARTVIIEESIKKWFSELNTYLEENNLLDILNDPDRVFNGDEAGFSLCPKSGKVLGPKGYKNLYSIKVGNEKENITVLIIFNASGNIADPLVVFPYIRPPKAVIENMPSNWILGK
ncbi:hypothetical protein QE152_g3812 [Popillia japonica]|uniref:Transposase n=1 Tax=Popillia japonica TaxID=7064 RepID=A0AAW1N167_POPJA